MPTSIDADGSRSTRECMQLQLQTSIAICERVPRPTATRRDGEWPNLPFGTFI